MMVLLLRKCRQCGSYTLNRSVCPYCGGGLKVPHPPKFSPEDKYLRFRMALKMESPKE
jgi:H/ACA ribonucleoprotein complex subunit 3